MEEQYVSVGNNNILNLKKLMSSSFLQSKAFKAILSLIVLVLTFISLTAFAAWSGPTSSSDARSPFLNLGPVTQTKTGRLNITTGSASVLTSAKFEVAGPAMLAGGINAAGSGSQTSALVLGDVYVGYVGSPAVAATINTASPATPFYELNGNVMVSNNIKAQNLSHSNMGGLNPVCTTASGWLIPCSITLPTLTLPEVCGNPAASNYAGPYLQNTVTFNNDLCLFYPIDPVYEGCFTAGTQVLMADGSYKKIEDVATGEVIQSSAGPEKVMKKYVIDYQGPLYALNGSDDYFVSDTHPFMTTEGWKSFAPERTRIESPTLEVSQLEIGDILVKENGEREVLHSFDSIESRQTVYNFGLNGTRDFYADGYLVHNVDLFPIAHALPSVGWKGGLCGGGYPGASSGYNYQEWLDICDSGDDGGNTSFTTCADLNCGGTSVCCSYYSGGNAMCVPNPSGLSVGQVCAP